MKVRSYSARRVLAAAVLVVLGGEQWVEGATTRTWGAASGNWSATSSWSGGVLPVSGDNAVLGANGSIGTITATLNVSPPLLNAITIDANSSLTGATLSQTTNVNLQVSTEIIGNTHSGNSHIQSAGTNTVTYLYLAATAGGSGQYSLSGTGTLFAETAVAGYVGPLLGSIIQSGGSASISTLYLGLISNSMGTYALSGSGSSLSTTQEYVGYNGSGSFNQSGGTHTVSTQLNIGYNAPDFFAGYTMNGGNLSVGNSSQYGELNLGVSSSANFYQNAGSVDLSHARLILGTNSGSTGYYFMNGGTLIADSVIVGHKGSSGGDGEFHHQGGTVTVGANGLVIGNYQSAGGGYYLSGSATLNTPNEVIGNAATGSSSFTQNTGTTHTVSGSFIMGTGGSSADSTYLMTGGVLNLASALIGNGGNAQFTQTGGGVSVSQELAIGNNFVPGITNRYTLGGGTLTMTGSGVINIRPGGQFNQGGGTLTGRLTNSGEFRYGGGNFNALLENQAGGVVTFDGNSASLIADQGVINRGSITVPAGDALGAGSGSALENEASLELAGGSLLGAGTIENNGTIDGWGLIGGAGGFTNNGIFTQGAGLLVISNTGTNSNNALISLATGRQVQISTNLANAGSLTLNQSLVSGAGSLTNGAPGILSGPGTISTASFANAGTLLIPAGTTRISVNHTNWGLVQLNDIAASLTGGNITNTGTIQGAGRVASSIVNSGTIAPGSNATLTLAGLLTNNGLLLLPAGGKLLVTGAFPINGGTITLQGGSLDTNSQPLNNNSVIAGYGTLSTGGTGLANNGSITFTGGNTTVTGPVTNNAGKTIEARFNPVLFTGAVVNNGTIKVTGTTVTFAGAYAGTAPSEPGGIARDPAFLVPNDGGVSGPGGVVVDPGGTLVVSYLRQSSLAAMSGTILTRPSAAGGQASVLSALTLSGSASLDLADNNLILDLPNSTEVATATAQLRGYLRNNQVTSSVAAADIQHRLGIGYADNALLGETTWGGQSADSTALVTRLTYVGDANLDGVLNADDYALLDRGFAKHSSVWTFGDFNYDAQVNSADYLLIDTVVGQLQGLSPGFVAMREAQFGEEYVAQLLTSVPEPSMTGILAGTILLGRRRKRN